MNDFRAKALTLLRANPASVHRVKQQRTLSAPAPDEVGHYLFGQGYEEFEVELDLSMNLPTPRKGVLGRLSYRQYQKTRTTAEAEAHDRAIQAVVDILDRRLSPEDKARLLSLLASLED